MAPKMMTNNNNKVTKKDDIFVNLAIFESIFITRSSSPMPIGKEKYLYPHGSAKPPDVMEPITLTETDMKKK